MPALTCALLHALWQLALIALLATASFSAMRRHSAAARHAAGMAWLLAMLLAPGATMVLCLVAPAAAGQVSAAVALIPAPLSTGVAAAPGAGATMQPVLPAWAAWLAAAAPPLWLAGVAVMLTRQAGGWRALCSLERQRYTELPPAWRTRFEILGARIGIARPVQVRVTDSALAAGSPFTARLLRPIIWLPLSALTHLPPDQLAALLAHELAHIRRMDWLWNGLQCMAESLLFFHPGMWWLSRRIRQEREHACDDLAVDACGDPVALAEALTALQRLRQAGAVPGATRTAFPRMVLAAGGGMLATRVAHILSLPAAAPLRLRSLGGLLLLLCAGMPLAEQFRMQRHPAHAPAAVTAPAIPAAPPLPPLPLPPMPPAPPVPPGAPAQRLPLSPFAIAAYSAPMPPAPPAPRRAVPAPPAPPPPAEIPLPPAPPAPAQ
jgi:beta-lactamase regulating signal transducer with metallopeptidase domain